MNNALLVIIIEPNDRPPGALDRPLSDGFPCVGAELVLFQRVAEEHHVVWLDHLQEDMLSTISNKVLPSLHPRGRSLPSDQCSTSKTLRREPPRGPSSSLLSCPSRIWSRRPLRHARTGSHWLCSSICRWCRRGRSRSVDHVSSPRSPSFGESPIL